MEEKLTSIVRSLRSSSEVAMEIASDCLDGSRRYIIAAPRPRICSVIVALKNYVLVLDYAARWDVSLFRLSEV